MKMTSFFWPFCFSLIGIFGLQACSKLSADSSATTAASQQWMVNINEAYAQSVKDQKPVLAYFTSSDTCVLCKQLDANVLASPTFTTWAEKKVVLFKVDFATLDQLPKGNQEQNAAMAQSLKATTYPTIWMLNVAHEVENGRFKVKPLGYTGYQPSPEKLIGMLQNFVPRK